MQDASAPTPTAAQQTLPAPHQGLKNSTQKSGNRFSPVPMLHARICTLVMPPMQRTLT